MEPFTLDRNMLKQDVVDNFASVIWTERYYGDGDVELVVPATSEMFRKLPMGTFLGVNDSNEIMILETWNIEGGQLKLKGISLLQWLNNRFVRTSAKHEDKHWPLQGGQCGDILWTIVYNMCCYGSPYLTGTIPTGISNPQELQIYGLGMGNVDKSGPIFEVAVPFGPVYDAIKEIATTHEVGMSLTLDWAVSGGYFLGFNSYKGIDRTSSQTVYPVVRFSPQMDSFTDIKEIQSIAALKTLVYAFAPGLNPDGGPALATTPGVSRLSGPQYTGFDLRALLLFADDIDTDMVAGDASRVVGMLNARALDALTTNNFIKSVDGEIVPDSQFKYGEHYGLGDIIEVEGNTEVLQPARITEYIRSQDSAGEKAYPTVTIIA